MKMSAPTLASRAALASLVAAATLAAGCTSLVGRPASPLTVTRDEPGVMLCTSARTSSGGIRLVGELNMGIYPITKASIEYRTAAASDGVPATLAGKSYELTAARTEKGEYRKSAKQVVYTIGPEGAKNLGDRVIWYRWIIEYAKGGGTRSDVTEIHRTSVDEAGLPRSATTPGPDTSVGPVPLSQR